jgi:hypothetical protein
VSLPVYRAYPSFFVIGCKRCKLNLNGHYSIETSIAPDVLEII